MIQLVSQQGLDEMIRQHLKSIPAEFQFFAPELSELIVLYSEFKISETRLLFSSDRKHPGYPIPLIGILAVSSNQYTFDYWSENHYSDHSLAKKSRDEAREHLQYLIQLRRCE